MHVQHIADLVLLAVIFRGFMALLAVPISLAQAFLTAEGGGAKSAATSQVLFTVLFSALLGAAGGLFARLPDTGNPWFYGVTGMVITLGVLANNVRSKQQNPVPLPDLAAGGCYGANLGFYLGPVIYIIALLMPSVVLAIPGTDVLLDWAFAFAGWITSFAIIKALILIAALWWFLKTVGLVFFLGGVAFFGFLSLFGGTGGPQSAE